MTVKERLKGLYTDFYPYVYGRALYLIRNETDAEDVVSDVFIRVAKGLKKDPDVKITKASLIRITTQVCIDRWRGKKGKTMLSVDERRINHEALSIIDDATAGIMLAEIFETLPKRLRHIAIYYFVDGFTLKEIVDITGISERTLRRRLKKIQKILAANT